MCTYGIGLPFDHPIWQNLPPCSCSGEARLFPSVWTVPQDIGAWRLVINDSPVMLDDEPDPTELLAVP